MVKRPPKVEFEIDIEDKYYVISLKTKPRFARELDMIVKKHGFSSRSELIRKAIIYYVRNVLGEEIMEY